MWVVIGNETINIERCNIIRPTEDGGTKFVFDGYSVTCEIPYEDVVETVTRKHK